jgi:hypothetical protein
MATRPASNSPNHRLVRSAPCSLHPLLSARRESWRIRAPPQLPPRTQPRSSPGPRPATASVSYTRTALAPSTVALTVSQRYSLLPLASLIPIWRFPPSDAPPSSFDELARTASLCVTYPSLFCSRGLSATVRPTASYSAVLARLYLGGYGHARFTHGSLCVKWHGRARPAGAQLYAISSLPDVRASSQPCAPCVGTGHLP